MNNDKYSQLQNILPDREIPLDTRKSVRQSVDASSTQKNAAQLARIKSQERRRIKECQERIDAEVSKPDYQKVYRNPSYMPAASKSIKPVEMEKEARERAIDALEKVDPSQPELILPEEANIAVTKTSREITRLLNTLGLNLNVRFTKTDMRNLLGAILTCNTAQLNELLLNDELPVSLRTVVVGMLADARTGNIGRIMSLFDRVFGTQSFAEETPAEAGGQGATFKLLGDGSGKPISRQAYLEIKRVWLKETPEQPPVGVAETSGFHDLHDDMPDDDTDDQTGN